MALAAWARVPLTPPPRRWLMLFFNFGVSAHRAVLRGPDPRAIDSAVNWNVHESELQG